MTQRDAIKALFASAALSAACAASAAHAQQTAYDVSLRSIAPPTINTSAYESRARQTILSIAPASLNNQPAMVPAVYDPSVGHFVSALSTTRGAIAVSSTGAVSVIVNSQNSSLLLGASGFPLRSATVSAAPAEVTTQQIATSATTNTR